MKRVLLVANHDLFRQALAIVLEQSTDLRENVQAGSLAEARQLLDDLDGQVDLAVVDFDLPDGGITELIRYVRELDVPVLAYTAGISLEQRARALQAGADEVLSTASSSEEIVGAARRLSGR